jgi:hypothetical protein
MIITQLLFDLTGFFHKAAMERNESRPAGPIT